MSKKELETKKELARFYYMQGEAQKTIAQKVGVTEITVSRWVNKEGWQAKRAGASITRPELVNKILLAINRLLDKVNESDDAGAIIDISDKLSKFAAAIEKIDKKSNVVDAMENFAAFDKWLIFRQQFDEELTPELIKTINRYQDLYLSECISGGHKL
jgi:DNA-directed RNA polymerase specialized sigma subunit